MCQYVLFQGVYDRVMCGIDMAPFVYYCRHKKMKTEIGESGMDLIKSLCKRSPTSRLGLENKILKNYLHTYVNNAAFML